MSSTSPASLGRTNCSLSLAWIVIPFAHNVLTFSSCSFHENLHRRRRGEFLLLSLFPKEEEEREREAFFPFNPETAPSSTAQSLPFFLLPSSLLALCVYSLWRTGSNKEKLWYVPLSLSVSPSNAPQKRASFKLRRRGRARREGSTAQSHLG